MAATTLYWHDYETFGISPARDKPSQFAGIRTDEDLTIIGEPLQLYCKPPRDALPSPEACLVTGISPQYADAHGVAEPEFIRQIQHEFSVAGTCGVGYNSLRFDDEVTRYGLYRNFYDPYEREWRNGNSRWDIIDMLRLTRALRPEGIQWPDHDDGFPSFKLELLTDANGISHESAHDALSDVTATIAMAKLVKTCQPELYQYVFEHRLKHQVAKVIQLSQLRPFLHVSGRLPRENGYTGLMIPLAVDTSNKNAILCFNLSGDYEQLLELSAEEIRQRVFTRAEDLPEGQGRIPLKAVHINRCPIVATPKLLDAVTAERLHIDLAHCEQSWRTICGLDTATKQSLMDKVAAVFSEKPDLQNNDVEQQLYNGFLPDSDRGLLVEVRTALQQQQGDYLAQLQYQFLDPRYQQLVFLTRARYLPDTLTTEESQRWKTHCAERIIEGKDGYLSLVDYRQAIDNLLSSAPSAESQCGVLTELSSWADFLVDSNGLKRHVNGQP